MLRLYSTIILIISPLLLVYTLYQAYRRKGGLRFILQRMGLYFGRAGSNEVTALWFHAASVGETKAVLPLIRSLSVSLAQPRVVITTNTPEAALLVRKELGAEAEHYYFTTDFPVAAKRLVNLINPKVLFVVETEIWPNLYHYCFDHDIPVVIVNGRLSEKSMVDNSFIRALYKSVLSRITLIMARFPEDAERFVCLGAPPSKVSVFGNIKWAAAMEPWQEPFSDVAKRQYFLAISTHEGEEKVLLDIWQRNDDLPLLIIIPRHPNRRANILSEINDRHMTAAIRSRGDTISSQTGVYLADTVGEVNGFLKNAMAVFVGGSLVPVGGHNVLEPAVYYKPIFCGPYTQSFRDEVALLKDAGALQEVADAVELEKQLIQLMASEQLAHKMSESAKSVVADCENILQRYEQQCKAILAENSRC